jgi:hypothetical protein
VPSQATNTPAAGAALVSTATSTPSGPASPSSTPTPTRPVVSPLVAAQTRFTPDEVEVLSITEERLVERESAAPAQVPGPPVQLPRASDTSDGGPVARIQNTFDSLVAAVTRAQPLNQDLNPCGEPPTVWPVPGHRRRRTLRVHGRLAHRERNPGLSGVPRSVWQERR